MPKKDPNSALMTVLSALDALTDAERLWVLQSAANRWTLTGQAQNLGGGTIAGGGASQQQGGQTGEAQAAISANNPRSFMRMKKPGSDVQRVACLGYFHMKTTGQHGFSSKDIQKLNTDSGGTAFNLPRAMDNATRGSKYLSNRGPREKQLTTLGEDVVEALPDPQAVAAAEQAAKRPRSARGKRKTKKRA